MRDQIEISDLDENTMAVAKMALEAALEANSRGDLDATAGELLNTAADSAANDFGLDRNEAVAAMKYHLRAKAKQLGVE